MRINSQSTSSTTWSGFASTHGAAAWVHGMGWQPFGGLRVTESTSTSVRADGTVRLHEAKSFDGSILESADTLAGQGARTSSVALTFPHPRTGARISIPDLIASLRAAGITPHPWGEEADEQVAAWLAKAAAEPNLVRSRWFGTDRAQFAWDRTPGSAGAESIEDYGSFFDVLIDTAALGGSCFREGVTSDLIWHHVFPDEENGDGSLSKPGMIPRPADILANLRDQDFTSLSRFAIVLFAAIVTNTRIFPTVFARGGGEGLNSDPHANKNVLIFDPSVQVPDGAGGSHSEGPRRASCPLPRAPTTAWWRCGSLWRLRHSGRESGRPWRSGSRR